MRMLKSVGVFIVCMLCYAAVYAQDFKIIQFKQAMDLATTQQIQFELTELAQDTQFWTATYLIAHQGMPNDQAKLTMQIEPEGLLNVENPAVNPWIQQIKASQIQRSDHYLLTELPVLTAAIKQHTQVEIEAPLLQAENPVRVYAELVDWVPIYNHDDETTLTLSIPVQHGLYAAAVYVMVGQGAKPEELLRMTAKKEVNSSSQSVSLAEQVHAASESSVSAPQLTSNNSEAEPESNNKNIVIATFAILILGYWLWRRRR